MRNMQTLFSMGIKVDISRRPIAKRYHLQLKLAYRRMELLKTKKIGVQFVPSDNVNIRKL